MASLINFLKAKFFHSKKKTQAKLPPIEGKLDLTAHKDFLNQLLESGREKEEISARWQEYYNLLNLNEKQAIWQYANQRLPEVKTTNNEKLINLLWSRVFFNSDNLKKIAKDGSIHSEKGHGLVYRYIINGHVRYIGQTRERSLRWRMTKRQKSGMIGYNNAIRRNLLNAYRAGILAIETEKVRIRELDKKEEELIKHYGPLNKLWNKIHNENHFSVANYNS